MSAIEEVSKFILILLFAILIMQIVTNQNGLSWIASKFSADTNPLSKGSSSSSDTTSRTPPSYPINPGDPIVSVTPNFNLIPTGK